MYYLLSKDKEIALYKHNWLSRYYRSSFPIPDEKCFKLYQCKKLSTILRHREALYEYCGEWFDVYKDGEKVEILKEGK